MKKLISLFAIVLFVAMGSAYAQGWTYLGAFPDDNFKGSTGGHGVAVDPDGKVWCEFYGTTDSLFNGTAWQKCRAIYVFNADGTPVSFSPIKTVTVNGVTDTLWNSNRGMREDNNGNILIASFDVVYRLNYLTGEGMGKIQTAGITMTAPAVDPLGNVFTAPVSPGNPISMWTTDFTFIGNAVATSVGYSRSLEVSHDGNTIYWTGFTNNIIYIYSRPDEFSEFALADSILPGFACESPTWSRNGNLLYLSAGNRLTPANAYPGVTTYYSNDTWYGWDPTTGNLVDSIKWHYVDTIAFDFQERSRSLAFSPDGRYAYLCTYNRSDIPSFQKFEDPNWQSVDEQGQVVVDGYKLSQNYPNPFNPTTKINFELKNSGYTSLKVYDMLGNEVATLVNNELTSGTHSVNFNAANLASGTYVYQLNVNGTRITNKMILLK
jgi:hypothetical protein